VWNFIQAQAQNQTYIDGNDSVPSGEDMKRKRSNERGDRNKLKKYKNEVEEAEGESVKEDIIELTNIKW